MVWKCVPNRQNLDLFANDLCDQNNGTMGTEPRVQCTLTRRKGHLLIDSWFRSEYQMKFIDIYYKYKTEIFLFGIISVPLIRNKTPQFSDISIGGRSLSTPVYM